MGKILLENMEFYAFHGCYEAEQIVGNTFVVCLELESDMNDAARTDNLEDALNYVQVYDIVKAEMKIRANLLEHLADRILKKIHQQFPTLKNAKIKISKLNPPIGGQMKAVSVEMSL